MGFEQGLSGLEATSQNLAVIGNNVANAGTVGFKSSEVLFSDVYANSLTGAGSTQVGIGVAVQSVEQQFTQGNITSSDNPMDIAINGGGFYQMSENGTLSYSRNGQFQLNSSGYIVNSMGDVLQGYTANAAGVLQVGTTADLQINTASIAPVATSTVNEVLNLDATQPIAGVVAGPGGVPAAGPTVPFSEGVVGSYNNSSSVTIFDSLGDPHVLQTYYVNNGPVANGGTEDQWSVYASLDGADVSGAVPPTPIGTLAFNSSGALDVANSTSGAVAPAPAVPIPVPVTLANGATALALNVDFTGTTQYGATFATTTLTQNGYTTGQLSGFSASSNGTIVGSYTNGQTSTLGQITLANFTDPNGLQNLGNNEWAATATSGAALVGVPGTAQLGVLQSSATEDSNVDLTSQLVNMITAQEAYQANAQTIKTEDTMLQTLVTLR